MFPREIETLSYFDCSDFHRAAKNHQRLRSAKSPINIQARRFLSSAGCPPPISSLACWTTSSGISSRDGGVSGTPVGLPDSVEVGEGHVEGLPVLPPPEAVFDTFVPPEVGAGGAGGVGLFWVPEPVPVFEGVSSV